MARPQTAKCLLLFSFLLTFSVFASAFPKGILKRSGINDQARPVEDDTDMSSDGSRSFISEPAQHSDVEGVSDPMTFLNSERKLEGDIEWTIGPHNWLDSYFAPKSRRAQNIETKLQERLGDRMKGKVRTDRSDDPNSPSTDYRFNTMATGFEDILRVIKDVLSRGTQGTTIEEEHLK